MNTPATALIAEDEPLLAQTLANELCALWPAFIDITQITFSAYKNPAVRTHSE